MTTVDPILVARAEALNVLFAELMPTLQEISAEAIDVLARLEAARYDAHQTEDDESEAFQRATGSWDLINTFFGIEELFQHDRRMFAHPVFNASYDAALARWEQEQRAS